MSSNRSGVTSSWRISAWWCKDDRASVQLSLLRILCVSHQERLDCAPLLFALAQEHRGNSRRRLKQLARRLASGTSLVAALEQTPESLTDEDVLTLRFAAESGTMAVALRSLLERAANSSQDVKHRIRQSVVYFVSLSVVVGLATSFLMLFIAPTFRAMADEWGFDMQGALFPLYFLESCFGWFSRSLPLLILFALAGVTLIFIFKPRRIFRRFFASRLVRAIAQLRTAHLLRLLAQGVEAGRPVPGALSTLARYHYDRNVRGRLLFARNEVEQGADPWESLATANLFSKSESDALGASATPRTRAWLMHRLADWKELKVQQRLSLFAALIHPAVVLLFGAIVLWISFSFLGFLGVIIVSLS